MYLRKADINDIDYLSELVYNSEKSLNFDENYMSIFKDKYNVNKEFIENNYVKLKTVKIGEVKSLIDCNGIIPKLKFVV